jgi:phosphatidylglycerol:prolipoprotein diacylglycerol transferase
LPVHPTQLYSALAGLAVLAVLTVYYPRRRRDGEVMALLMIAYPISRFLIEILRGDEAPFVAGLTISQTISVLLLPCGLVFWSYLSRLPAVRYADQASEPPRQGLLISPAR